MTAGLDYDNLNFNNFVTSNVYSTTTTPYYTYTIGHPTRTIRYDPNPDAIRTIRISPDSGINSAFDEYEYIPIRTTPKEPTKDIEPEELDMLYGETENNE